jgi:hypothetical protein
MICFIPSKSRPGTKTYKLFEDVGIKVYHFIEPQEIESYNVPNKISIEKNDQGIGYVRNYMLNFARVNNMDWVIICDDDVDHFGVYRNANIKKDASIWIDIFNKVKNLPFEIYGINYRQLAWTEKKEYSINAKFVEVCILLNVKNIKWNYRPEFNLKEDRDFALQTIKYGNGIVRFNKFFYNCPDVGTNAGGLHNEYKNKKDELSAKKMISEWHPFITMQNKNGRLDIKTDIKGLSSFYKKTIK